MPHSTESTRCPTPPQGQTPLAESSLPNTLPVRYRLYKKRFSGLSALAILAITTGMPFIWFGPIATEAATEFGISVNQVNWLGNIVALIFIPVSLLIPVFCSRFGISRCAQLGTLMMLVSGWVRYAGTITSLDSRSSYALLIFGQAFSAVAQPIFQVLGPVYSEKWFDLKGRTTATMIIAISNPVGCALGQIISPLVGTVRESVLVLAIISAASVPAVFFISDAPPSPPTFAGSKPSQTLASLCRAILGWSVPSEAYMTPRERLDFIIITTIFGVLAGAANALSILSAEWFSPMGFSNMIAGLLGASMILSGLLAAIITAPLFDRIFVHRFGITLKTFVPIIACSWLSLIWAVRPNNAIALFVIMIVIGVCSFTILPVVLELGVELTRNADASSALLWCSANLFSIIFVLAEGALRAPASANPPYNMRNALILHGTIIMTASAFVFLICARQARREMDEAMAGQSLIPSPSTPDAAVASWQGGEVVGGLEFVREKSKEMI